MTLHGDPTSRMYQKHHARKAWDVLAHAAAVADDYDIDWDELRPTFMLDLLDALEHVALAYGLYVPGIGMERHPEAKVAGE